MNLKDVTENENGTGISLVSLSKLLSGKKIKYGVGDIGAPYGEAMFVVYHILLEDGTKLSMGGEHDCPYIEDDIPGISQDDMENLLEEEYNNLL